ncbi:hypothetical protein TWF718_009694 [Orbilia javanica]|uniref:Uncharacterized protein n=1 Tax=Orbilia javanica TaxID=47235 RepID=A0AAN8MTU0_9PEZI
MSSSNGPSPVGSLPTDPRYILARLTFADIWLALSIELELTLGHVVQAGKRNISEFPEELLSKFEVPTVDESWARRLCNCYGIPVDGSNNLVRTVPFAAGYADAIKEGSQEEGEFRIFFDQFIGICRPKHTAIPREYAKEFIKRFGITKAPETSEGILLKGTYYPSGFTLSNISLSFKDTTSFLFFVKLAVLNPFIQELKPPLLSLLTAVLLAVPSPAHRSSPALLQIHNHTPSDQTQERTALSTEPPRVSDLNGLVSTADTMDIQRPNPEENPQCASPLPSSGTSGNGGSGGAQFRGPYAESNSQKIHSSQYPSYGGIRKKASAGIHTPGLTRIGRSAYRGPH